MCVQLDYFNHLLHRMDVLPVPMSSELPVVLHRLSTESTCTRVASFVAKVLMPSLLYTNFATRETRHNRVPGGTTDSLLMGEEKVKCMKGAGKKGPRTTSPRAPDGSNLLSMLAVCLSLGISLLSLPPTQRIGPAARPIRMAGGLIIGFLRQFGPQFTGTKRPQNWFYSRELSNRNNNNNDHHNTYNARLSKLMQEKTRNAPPERGHRCGRTESDNAKTRRRARHNTRTKKAAKAC
uniref:Uncharacterized protein n=1 Tax=Anopheles arabiensis TaxID=7173 RepID=A0A2C9GPB2_ANOAR